jgi:hypothetical protein
LLPKNWFFVGLVGVSIDIAKIPGTILGAMIGRLRGLARSPNTIEKQDH